MNCNRLSVGALVLVLIASLAGVAMTLKGVALEAGWSLRLEPELAIPSAITAIKVPGESL